MEDLKPIDLSVLAKRIDEVARNTGRSETWISERAFGDWRRSGEIRRKERTITIDTFNQAIVSLDKIEAEHKTTPPSKGDV